MESKKVYLYKGIGYIKVESGGFYACCKCAFNSIDCTYLFHNVLGKSIGCERKIFEAIEIKDGLTFTHNSKMFNIKKIINLGG